MIKALLFDMDGTLVDSERYYTLGTYLWVNKIKEVSMNDVYSIIGLNMDETYKVLSRLTNLSYKEVVKLNSEYFNDRPINYNDYLFDDVRDTLYILKKQKYKLALCSLSDRAMVEQFIRECHLDNIFDIVLSNDEIKKSKPDPEIYLKALEIFNINAKEAIVIEDSYSGIMSGKNAGIKVFARNAKKYHINQEDADYIFDDMHAVLHKIK